MTKRVAWFTCEPDVKDTHTPYKVYEVFNEKGNWFTIINDKGFENYCLKKGCSHLNGKDWVFADVVEENAVKREGTIKTIPIKTKKWGEWIQHTTGEQPEGLDEDVKIKLKWSDGDVTKSTIGSANWYFSESVNITHYKVLLKDKPKWTKNKGVMPVDGNVKVEVKWRDGTKGKLEAEDFMWSLDDDFCDIVKWRLAE